MVRAFFVNLLQLLLKNTERLRAQVVVLYEDARWSVLSRCPITRPQAIGDVDIGNTSVSESLRETLPCLVLGQGNSAVKARVCMIDRNLPCRKRFPYKRRQAITRLASTNAHAVHMSLVITRFQQTRQGNLINRTYRRGVETKVAFKPLH